MRLQESVRQQPWLFKMHILIPLSQISFPKVEQEEMSAMWQQTFFNSEAITLMHANTNGTMKTSDS